MKKFFLPKTSILLLVVAACCFVACHFHITIVDISDENPEPGAEITVTAGFMADNSELYGKDCFHLYAIRVPVDWTGERLKLYEYCMAHPDDEEEQASPEMVECDAYAELCEYVFPREGYKWIAYQSRSASEYFTTGTAEVLLKVGSQIGDYDLDIMLGGMVGDPSELVRDGKINLEVAFGVRFNPQERSSAFSNASKDNAATCYYSSEGLFEACTLSTAEVDNRQDALSDVKITCDGVTLPISPYVYSCTDHHNGVRVKANSAIETIEAVEGGETEYFNLNGVKVVNPESGIYIVKRGEKVGREFVRRVTPKHPKTQL